MTAAGDVREAVTAPGLVGRRFCLLPVMPQHCPRIYELSIQENVTFRWRHRGSIPSYEQFLQSFHTGTLCQFVVAPVADRGAIAGYVACYNANHVDQIAYVAIVSAPGAEVGTLEGVLLLERYLFAYWPFRKLFVELPEYNLPQFAGALRAGLLEEEGRLRDCVYFQDRYWDKLILATSREAARRFGPRFDRLLGGQSGGGDAGNL